jgi:hypothetical protein
MFAIGTTATQSVSRRTLEWPAIVETSGGQTPDKHVMNIKMNSRTSGEAKPRQETILCGKGKYQMRPVLPDQQKNS